MRVAIHKNDSDSKKAEIGKGLTSREFTWQGIENPGENFVIVQPVVPMDKQLTDDIFLTKKKDSSDRSTFRVTATNENNKLLRFRDVAYAGAIVAIVTLGKNAREFILFKSMATYDSKYVAEFIRYLRDQHSGKSITILGFYTKQFYISDTRLGSVIQHVQNEFSQSPNIKTLLVPIQENFSDVIVDPRGGYILFHEKIEKMDLTSRQNLALHRNRSSLSNEKEGDANEDDEREVKHEHSQNDDEKYVGHFVSLENFQRETGVKVKSQHKKPTEGESSSGKSKKTRRRLKQGSMFKHPNQAEGSDDRQGDQQNKKKCLIM